jgi:hypothetical protein
VIGEKEAKKCPFFKRVFKKQKINFLLHILNLNVPFVYNKISSLAHREGRKFATDVQ